MSYPSLDGSYNICTLTNPCAEIPLQCCTVLPSGDKVTYHKDGKVYVVKKPYGFRLIREYPGCNRKIGDYEPFTTGEFIKYPDVWKPVYHPADKFGL